MAPGICTRKRARSWVRSGRAHWDGAACIRLVQADPRTQIVTQAQLDELRRRACYDGAANSGMASLQELHWIPVSNARRLLGMGRNTGAFSRLGA